MTISYTIHSNDLDVSLLESIKSFFKNKELTISIKEKVNKTAYFEADELTNIKILKGLEELKLNKGIKLKSVTDFKNFIHEKAKQ